MSSLVWDDNCICKEEGCLDLTRWIKYSWEADPEYLHRSRCLIVSKKPGGREFGPHLVK